MSLIKYDVFEWLDFDSYYRDFSLLFKSTWRFALHILSNLKKFCLSIPEQMFQWKPGIPRAIQLP